MPEKSFKEIINRLQSLGFEVYDEEGFLKYEGPKTEIVVPIPQLMENPNEGYDIIIEKLKREKEINVLG